MQFLLTKYPLSSREENRNNMDDTDNDITGRTNLMLDNSDVIFKWINYLETVSDEEFDKIVNDNAKNNNSNSLD
ncbi:MAG: hypothetical protein K0S93_960 [Nitrososphaeraceae archaeon]|nr:hypothetical protein [Nitrososphaeraceae archaeon]